MEFLHDPIRIERMHYQAIVPTYATDGSGCFDLYAAEAVDTLYGRQSVDPIATFHTGWAFEIPPGWAMLIFSRSGHGFKNDVRLSNCVGVIDSDYRGEVLVKLRNDEPFNPFDVKAGDRIAQAGIVRLPRVSFLEVDELSKTNRMGGFGSTGK